MSQHTYNDKSVSARHKRNMELQFVLRMSNGDLHFVADFIKGTAFYIEDLEEHIGEDLGDFWQSRDHAMRILTDWMMQSMVTSTSTITAKAA